MWSDSLSRRRFFATGLGFPALAAAAVTNPLKPKKPPMEASARSVIFLFMHGGPSHLETFDPKPELNRLSGQRVPPSFGLVQLQFSEFDKQPILGCKRTFQKYGRSGIEVSDLFPHLARRIDDIAVVRSMYHDGFTHTAALNLFNNGFPRLGRPSVGSWVVYGLGSESENLPGFVVMLEGGIKCGPVAYSAGFLPAAYQGTPLRNGPAPILNLASASHMKTAEQRDFVDTLGWFNQRHRDGRPAETELDARIAAYELAFKMQAAAPELSDISSETEATQRLYGIDEADTTDFGTRCLMARRLVERGVRFVQLWSGSTSGTMDWDGHKQCDANHVKMAAKVDKPIAALLQDLKARGLLESTLVVWGGEFGRTPVSDGNLNGGGDANGRDHNPYGFTIWLAGGGVRGGKVIGATDELGLRAVQDQVHVHDLHASILHLLGVDHTRLTFPFQGRDFRLTDVHGKIDLARKLRV
jgi:hypothetical protein